MLIQSPTCRHGLTFVCGAVAALAVACEAPSPAAPSYSYLCDYEHQPLSPDSITPWGTTVADDFAALAQTYAGTWTWSPSSPSYEIIGGATSMPAQVTLEIAAESYELFEHVSGGEDVDCWEDAITAKGRLIFVDEQGASFVDIGVTVQRIVGATNYSAVWEISPISAFSAIVLREAFDVPLVRGVGYWDDEGFRASFEFEGRGSMDEPGQGVVGPVARFEGDVGLIPSPNNQ